MFSKALYLTVGATLIICILAIARDRALLEPSSVVTDRTSRWRFDTERDANNHGLTSEQCDIAFPDLYQSIDRAVERRRSSTGNITKSDLARDGWRGSTISVLVWDHRIYILDAESPMYRSRAFSTLHSLNRALLAAPTQTVPNVEFVISLEDAPLTTGLPIWHYDHKWDDEDTWLMPGYGFYAWPEPAIGTYEEVRRRMQDVEANITFADKTPQLLWRGNVRMSELRNVLVDRTKNQSWADVLSFEWQNKDEVKEMRMNIEDHCRYQYLQHTEGVSWSGRLKYIQLCNSVVVSHRLEWTQHHQHLLVSEGEHQNYVMVKRDFSDLGEKIKYLLAHPEEGERIARNSVQTFRDRYITPASLSCYWRKLLKGWREVTWEPEFYETIDTEGEATRKWRGIPFESFDLMRKLKWEPT